MDITWYGHSCFRLRGRDVSIITDPFDRSLGFNLNRLTASIVTVSHDSPNHSSVLTLPGDARVVRGPGEYEIGGASITGVATPGERGGAERTKNTAYRFELDDLTVCHLGDVGKTLNPDQIDALKDPDVLLLPVGGVCTVSPAEAAEIASQLEPKLIVPMHYGLSGLPIKLEPVDRFRREMGLEEIKTVQRLTVTRSSLPETTTVLLLESAGIPR
ncbi:MAG: MBL fold metallo-hydrolase [Chloroflexi bacterium]|nr:MBL fold metallo-hydrolase [Chloroflexota bacterium]